jgi:CheY-like chemotaxis protein
MGNGIVREAQDFESFNKFSIEYDKMRTAGLSAEEIHGILLARIQRTQSLVSNEVVDFSKDNNTSTQQVDANNSHKAVPQTNPARNQIQTAVGTIIPTDTDKRPLAPSKPNKSKTIGLALLIDDSAVAAKVASKVLTTANFDVVTANSAKMGFDILFNRKSEIDVIFLDVVMPNVDGVECLSWIKDNAEVSHIPVYMLSGLEDQMLAEVCIERGAEGMLLKPLNVETVKTIVRSHGIGNKNGIDEDDKEATLTQRINSNHRNSDQNSNSFSISSTAGAKPPSINESGTISSEVKEKKIATGLPKNHPYASIASAAQPTTSIGGLVPAFKLVDSDFDEYIFPSTSTASAKKLTLLLFIPTIFCPALYEEDGFLMRFFHNYDLLTHSKQVIVACISGDLPFALGAAKKRFRIPFTLLSDPSLFVTQKIVGCIDMGPVLAYQELQDRHREDSNCDDEELTGRKDGNNQSKIIKPRSNLSDEIQQQILSVASHPQQTFYAPRLGMILLNRRREVLNMWLGQLPGSSKASSTANNSFHPKDVSMRRFPSNFKDWIVQVSNGGAMKGEPMDPDDPEVLQADTSKGRNGRPSNISQSIGREMDKQMHVESKDFDSSSRDNKQRYSRKKETAAIPAIVVPIVETASAITAVEDEKVAILVIDDSSVSSRVICNKLKSLGYAVHAAYDGQKGYDMLKKRALAYSVVLCDVVMPICDGIGFLRLLKNDEEVRHIPVVMLSGLEGDDLSQNCMDLGARALLKKPFDEHKFLDIMRELSLFNSN